MKFSSSTEQRDYFAKNRFVAFEGLFKPEELQVLNQVIDGLPKTNRGRDIFREDPAVKKVIFSRRLVELAFDLLQKKPIRFAFDQVLFEKPAFQKNQQEPLEPPKTFLDLSCVRPLECVFLICIQSAVFAEPETSPTTAFALEPGSGILARPDVIFPFMNFSPSPSRRYLMIAYGNSHSQYLYEPQDPGCHFLKSLGYVFGDRLNEKLHPTLLH